MRHSIFKQLKEIKHIINGYPDFVYAGSDNFELDGIPVFLYHSIDPKVFEEHLIYLKQNDYRTLTVHEFHDLLSKKKELTDKKVVLLTIDDARSSVWRFGFPLLKKYELCATVFVIPGVTKEGACSLNLEDFWDKKCEYHDIVELDTEDSTLCTWQEIDVMYKSGLVSIESHTLFHREVFSSSKIINFATDESEILPYNFIGSSYFSPSVLSKEINFKDYFGLPIFESSPLMLAGPKLDVNSEFVLKCKEIYYNRKLNRDEKSWKKSIQKIVDDPTARKMYFHFEANSIKDAIDDLTLARSLIQQKLDSEAGNHLCLPWTIGNDVTVKICRELGIMSCFWGILPNKKINHYGGDLYYISRIKNDFIFRLPGKGRRSFFSVYNYKIKRRLSGEKVY